VLDLPAGATLLVTGAAGGVGGFAVELAALRGLRVLGLARAADEESVRKLGADDFIAAADGELATAARQRVPGGVDAVLDAAVLGAPALSALRGGGQFVAVAPDAVPAALRGTQVKLVLVRADGAQLAHLAALVDAGRLTLRVASTHSFAEAAKAHEVMARGGLRGRRVLDPAA
jgi:NADPH:quinone reductase-like Zn-dependent oxidoreductase